MTLGGESLIRWPERHLRPLSSRHTGQSVWGGVVISIDRAGGVDYVLRPRPSAVGTSPAIQKTGRPIVIERISSVLPCKAPNTRMVTIESRVTSSKRAAISSAAERCISPNNDREISVGPLAGLGTSDLDSDQVTVGGNDLSTMVTRPRSGVIEDDGDAGGSSGSPLNGGAAF
jgi:hypothetical protein